MTIPCCPAVTWLSHVWELTLFNIEYHAEYPRTTNLKYKYLPIWQRTPFLESIYVSLGQQSLPERIDMYDTIWYCKLRIVNFMSGKCYNWIYINIYYWNGIHIVDMLVYWRTQMQTKVDDVYGSILLCFKNTLNKVIHLQF